MARIRSVKPDLRTSEVVASWPVEVRYFFVLLWGYLDDNGRGLDVPKTIAGDCFPHDDRITTTTVDKWINLMANTKIDPNKQPPVCRYEVGGRRYLHCVNWNEHQKVNRPTTSRLPPCPVHEPLTELGSELGSEPVSGSAREPPLNSHSTDATRVSEMEGGYEEVGEWVPPSAGRVATRDAEPDTTQRLIGEWLDHCPKRPPGSVIAQIGKHLKAMLAEGMDPADLRKGLAAWHGKKLHPSTLPSVVNEIINGPPTAVTRPSTTDARVAQALAAGERVQAMLDAQATRTEITT